jgi:tetratricopeptide (TPR) repeat protein
MGLLLDTKGDLDGAIVEYRKALELDPSGAEGHFRLGRDLRDQGDLEAALDELQTAARLNPKNEMYGKAAIDLQQQLNH